jgi:hypothetical protein
MMIASGPDAAIRREDDRMNSRPLTPRSQSAARLSCASQESLNSLPPEDRHNNHTGTLSTVVLAEPGEMSTPLLESNLLTADSSSSPASCWAAGSQQLSNSCSDYVITGRRAGRKSCCSREAAAAAAAAQETGMGQRASSEPEHLLLFASKCACAGQARQSGTANQDGRLGTASTNQWHGDVSRTHSAENGGSQNKLIHPTSTRHRTGYDHFKLKKIISYIG